MAIIAENILDDVKTYLADMKKPVTVDFYPQTESPATQPMRELLQQLHALAPQIELVEHQEPAQLVPPENPGDIEGPVTTFSVGGRFTGIRYLGFPGGHEFSTFLGDLVDVSTDQPLELSPATQEWLSNLKEPLHLEVFVTPT